jgi:hypothetical protein
MISILSLTTLDWLPGVLAFCCFTTGRCIVYIVIVRYEFETVVMLSLSLLMNHIAI